MQVKNSFYVSYSRRLGTFSDPTSLNALERLVDLTLRAFPNFFGKKVGRFPSETILTVLNFDIEVVAVKMKPYRF